VKKQLSIVVAAAVVLTACGGDNNKPNLVATETPIPTAPAAARPTYIVQRGNVQENFEFTGRWLPRDQMQLSFQAAGTIRSVNVQRGDTVKTGDLLADFDTSDLEAQLTNAELDLQTAINHLESGGDGSTQTVLDAQFALADAKLNLESTEGNSPWTSLESARIGLERAQNAIDDAQRAYDEAISHPETPASTVDNLYQQLRDAEIGLRDAQNSYYSAAQSFNNHQISIAQQENAVLKQEINLEEAITGAGVDPDLVQAVQKAQLQVTQIKAEIEKASLRAPIDGMVLEVTIRAGDQAEAFKAVITLALPEPMEAIATLAFNDTQSLSVGMTGVCQEMGRPETAVQCAVRQVPLSSRDADQTVRVGAQLDLPLGQVVEIKIPLQVRENVLWLPPAAIRTFQNRTFVVVETAEGQRAVDVQIGLQTTERVEIISGVNEGDVVVGP